ncbi:MAG TPA: sulfite dehydrogenase [Candidatus Acidoferrales bacterium]|jgi:sulfane dehydrogenase subunit SoxC|nr:sulfite dehydrogenase [Candidatus Acidoferrales bacterium]
MANPENGNTAELREGAVAGSGQLNRRTLLRTALFSAGIAAASGKIVQADDSVGADAPEWMKIPGRPFSAYGTPSKWQEKVQRIFTIAPGRAGTGVSRTPLHLLEGTITPAGLHFERHHNGVPDIDPGQHQLFIHGMVKRPLVFSLDALMRYPMETRIHFVECSGNSGVFNQPQPPQMSAGELNGLLSCSEWTGVRLATLLAEAGLTKEAKWVVAEGADAAAMSRSIPLEKCMDDAMVALYQNGEAIRPEQGFPMRLLLPGFEGNMNVKWLRRLNVTSVPVDARDETSHYTELMPDGKARQFMFLQGAKSAIIKPSFGMSMKEPGLYEVSGLAWSGAGRISKVEVSADGGQTWAPAALGEPVLSKSLTRFRLPWHWDGRPCTLMSRATDETGGTQPTRASWMAQYAPGQQYHFNGMQSWSVELDGTVKNVYV